MFNSRLLSGVILVIACMLSVTVTNSFAESDNIPELLTEISESERRSDSMSSLIPHRTYVQQSGLFFANVSALDSSQINITVFDETITLSKDRIGEHDLGDYAWYGTGNATSAILLVDDTTLFGVIETRDATYFIEFTEMEHVHWLHEMDLSMLPPEYGYAEGETYERTTRSHLDPTISNNFDILADIYDGTRDYTGNPVVINIFIGYTDAAANHKRGDILAKLEIALGIHRANVSYNANQLPITLNVVGMMRAPGYVEQNSEPDRDALRNDSLFGNLRQTAIQHEADVLVLVTYNPNRDACGIASRILAVNAADSIATADIVCLVSHTLAHEVGHLQGAAHDLESMIPIRNNEFDFGHGFYSVANNGLSGDRTVMSYVCPNLTENTCPRQALWSDPHRNFIGTTTPAGSIDNEWNARVLFATAPYIASLAGNAQTYDNASPVGIVEWVLEVRNLLINVFFDEELHDQYPLTITITEHAENTVADMTRVTATHYTYTHAKVNDAETIRISLSNARDIYGNEVVSRPSSGNTITVSVPDRTDPMIMAPDDKTVEAKGYRTSVALGTPTVSDNRDPNPRITNDAPSSGFLVKTTTVTWTARDSSGNTATDTQIITVQDTTPPTITKPANKTFEATGEMTSLTSAQIGTATANDRVDPNPTIRRDTVSTFRVGTTAITWTATDSSGNSDIATQIITVQDTTPPAITKPTNKTFEATGERTLLTADDIGTATANDRVDSNPTVTSNIPQSFEFGVTATPITWTATDSYGNSDTATQIITIRDTTSPDITAPADVSFTTTDTSIVLTSANYSTATATDLVDSSPTITNNAPPSFRADRTTTITWTATDDYGNSAHAPQLVTVMHSSLMIFVPIDITVEAEHVNNIVNIGTANATHDTDNNITINNDAPQLFDVGVTVVTWTATDSIGVTVTATQTVTVQDTTDPVFDPVTNLDFIFEPDVPLVIYYDYPVATDLDNLAVDVTCTPASGTIFNEGSNTVTCTATDDSGNSANTTFNVNVTVFSTTIFLDNFEDGNLDGWTRTGDHELWNAMPLDEAAYPPDHPATNKVAQAILCEVVCVMSMTGFDLSMQADPEFLQFYRYVDNSLDAGAYLSVDVYDGSSWTELDRWSLESSDNDDIWHLEEYSLSDYTEVTDFGVRFTVFSDAFNEAVGIDDVKLFVVPVPVEPLAVTAPADVTAEAAGILTSVNVGTATTSGGSGDITITSDSTPPFPLGTTTILWTATDSDGTTATDTQVILVQDTTEPAITAPPDASFTTAGTSVTLTSSEYGTATATDLIDSSPTIDSNAPDLFPLGNTTITWTATDDYGNSAQATQNVMVVLSSLMITAPADITVEATGTLTTVDIGNAIATHDTDTNITVTNDAPPSFRVGTTTITWTATDSVNDVVTDTQTIIVQDTTNPVFSSVTDLDFVFEPGVPLAINYDSPTATDSVDASVDVTCAPASGTVFSGGTTGVTCTATDDSGNTASLMFSIDVLVLSTTVFLDDFEDGRLNGWTVTDYIDTWDSYPPEGGVNPPDHPSTNKVAQVSWCDITCTMSITGFDLSGNSYPEFLQFYRYVDDTLDNGEYLSLEVYDGSSWTELDRWTPEDSDDDDAWHLEEYSLADYTEVTDFGMRFTTVMSSLDEAVAIDDVKIFIVP
jgi:hypothetical protein